MRILMTGATGFLGSHLVKALLREGHQVIILKRSFSDTKKINNILHQVIAYNIDQVNLETPFIEQGNIDVVIHTATNYGRNSESDLEIFDANTYFPLKVLEKAVLFKTGLFINTDTALGKYLNSYSLSKRQFTEWGNFFSKKGKIRFVNLRLEHFYGPGDDDSKFTTYVIKRCLENYPVLNLTKGEQKRDFIYVNDVIGVYLLLLKVLNHRQTPMYQEFDVGSGTTISIREFVELVHRLTNSKTILKFGVIPYREDEIMESKADIRPLISLGWERKTSLIDGLKITIDKERKK